MKSQKVGNLLNLRSYITVNSKIIQQGENSEIVKKKEAVLNEQEIIINFRLNLPARMVKESKVRTKEHPY